MQATSHYKNDTQRKVRFGLFNSVSQPITENVSASGGSTRTEEISDTYPYYSVAAWLYDGDHAIYPGQGTAYTPPCKLRRGKITTSISMVNG